MKAFKYILTIVVIIVIVLLFKKHKQAPAPVSTTPNGLGTELCYVWNTEAGDNATLRMEFNGKGDAGITGSFRWLPAEKDRKTGDFAGVFNGGAEKGEADVWWQTSAEGMTATEQLFIRFDSATAAVGFGEMKDRGDGVYVYANPQALSYAPTLSKTDCSDPALK